MRNPFNLVAALFFSSLCASGQEGDGWGFLNIANLIPMAESCEISIGGETVVPDGLKGGDYTGWFMVKKGSKTISISLGELDESKGDIQIVEGAGNLIGIYLEPDKRLDKEGKPLPPKIRIKSFPTYETKGFGLRFVSLLPEKSRFQLGGMKVEAEAWKPLEVPKWNGGGFEILHTGKSIGKIPKADENGSFYLLVGTDHQDAFASVLVSSNGQEVPEYLRPENRKEEREPAEAENPSPQP